MKLRICLGLIVFLCFEASHSLKYHNYDETTDFLLKINENKKCADITHVYYLNGTSFEGKKFIAIAVSDNPKEHELLEPEFKWVANIHGNEVVGKEMALNLLDMLCRDYQKDPVVTWLIDNTRIHILPTMNPDSNDKVYSEKRNKDGTVDWLKYRANANNVDLNRDFPDVDIILFNGSGSNNHVLELTELSKFEIQPETRSVIDWMIHTPFVLSTALHGGDLVANYPFDESLTGAMQEENPSPDNQMFRQLALSYSQNHGQMADPNHKKCDMSGDDDFTENGGITNGAAWYSVAGGMQDFNYLTFNCFEITLELGCDKFPMENKLKQFWIDNREAMMAYMFQVHAGVKGMITDNTGKGIGKAVIEVYRTEGNDDDYIDHDILSNKGGDYYRLLPDGDYLVVVRAEGYKPRGECARVDTMERQRNMNYMNLDNLNLEANTLDFQLEEGNDNSYRPQPTLCSEQMREIWELFQ